MRYGWVAAAVALMFAAPASADVTARFLQAEGPPLVIQVNDRGDSRMAVTDGVYLSRDGVNHMILTLRGTTFVVRQEDFLAVLNEFTSFMRPTGGADQGVEISEHGNETVGGRLGTVYRVGEPGSADFVEFVLSTDPDLAPVGRVFRALFLPMLAAQGASWRQATQALSDLLARGTMIRFGELFQLEAVEVAPIAPTAFDLPSPPVSREVLRERLLSDTDR